MKKLALSLAAFAAVASLAVPITSSAAKAPAACVVVNGPAGLHLQLGYAPNGPSDCTVLP